MSLAAGPDPPLFAIITSTVPFVVVGGCLIGRAGGLGLFYCFFARFFLVFSLEVLVDLTFPPEEILIWGMPEEFFS